MAKSPEATVILSSYPESLCFDDGHDSDRNYHHALIPKMMHIPEVIVRFHDLAIFFELFDRGITRTSAPS